MIAAITKVLTSIRDILLMLSFLFKGLSTNGIADDSIIVSSTEEGYNKNVSLMRIQWKEKIRRLSICSLFLENAMLCLFTF
jgi:hypothetical protein